MNITYLLGAGASANCLPVINELPDRLRRLHYELEQRTRDRNVDTHLKIPYTERIYKTALNLKSDILDVLKDLEPHNTVDTLARKHYLRGETHKLAVLKRVLIIYFLYEQSFKIGSIRDITEGGVTTQIPKELPDKRYDSFIATVISDKIKDLSLPKNFNVITWNYDIQLELAYKEYQAELELPELQSKLQAIPSSQFLNNGTTVDLSRFCVVRLNGVAALDTYVADTTYIKPPYDDEDLQSLYTNLLKQYESISEKELKLFNYSWENPEEFQLAHKELATLKQIAKRIMQQTHILVVIGYSFPVFNRAVDKEMFSSFINLSKVYVQDKNPDDIISLMRSAFPYLSEKSEIQKYTPTEFISVKYTNQFVIPSEAF